jgi:predicted amidohydrolase
MANQCGGELLGKSKVIGPDGTTVAQAGRVGEADSAEFLVVTVDFDHGIQEADRTAAALWEGVPAQSRR